MSTSKGYELKKGVLLQAFGHPEKVCTNLTLTDELAEWYLKHYPEKAIYFAKIPVTTPDIIPAEVIIVPPVVPPIVEPEMIKIPNPFIEPEEKPEEQKKEPKKRKPAKSKK